MFIAPDIPLSIILIVACSLPCYLITLYYSKKELKDIESYLHTNNLLVKEGEMAKDALKEIKLSIKEIQALMGTLPIKREFELKMIKNTGKLHLTKLKERK